MSNIKITDFFQQIKKGQSTIQNELETETLHAQFYKDCFERQNEACFEDECIKTKSELSTQAKNLIAKCEVHEKQIAICSHIISDKNREIQMLRMQLETSENGDSSNTEPKNTALNIEPIKKNPDKVSLIHTETSLHIEPIYENSGNVNPIQTTASLDYNFKEFSSEQLAKLQSIGLTTREDSTFVLTVVRALYEERLEVLDKRTVSGRNKNKEKMTPEKLSTIRKIFRQRLSKVTDDKEKRLKRLTELIKNAQYSIAKSLKTKVIAEEVARKLFP